MSWCTFQAHIAYLHLNACSKLPKIYFLGEKIDPSNKQEEEKKSVTSNFYEPLKFKKHHHLVPWALEFNP